MERMTIMTEQKVLDEIAGFGVVPVIAMESVAAALPLADALIEGGLPVVEITFRTAAAAKVIETLRQHRPQLLVGAGTVLTMANLHAARDSGAQFAVAPGFNPDIVRHASEMRMPFVPGVATASEIEQALALGGAMQKFFPAELLGGVKMLKALAAPYGHTGVRFMPTGGVHIANLESYLACHVVAAVGGTWIATRDNLAAGHWSEIRNCCKTALEVVRRVRGNS